MNEHPCMGPVAVLGAGTIGASWAAFFALHGMDVRLYDDDRDALAVGLSAATQALDSMLELGLASEDNVAEATVRLHVSDSFESMADGAAFVQESVRETYEIKKVVFARLDELLEPETIIASSSSGLLITEIQKVMKIPGRSLIAHPFNPPHLIPLVELVGGEATSKETMRRAYEFFEQLGKTPVVLNKEVPGHIANRLAAALWREALDLVSSGVASVEDVDRALAAGPGLRWAAMGQHMIYHLGGGKGGYQEFMDHIGTAFEEYWRTMATWTEIPEDAKSLAVAGVRDSLKGRSSAELATERDRKLAAILKALDSMPQ